MNQCFACSKHMGYTTMIKDHERRLAARCNVGGLAVDCSAKLNIGGTNTVTVVGSIGTVRCGAWVNDDGAVVITGWWSREMAGATIGKAREWGTCLGAVPWVLALGVSHALPNSLCITQRLVLLHLENGSPGDSGSQHWSGKRRHKTSSGRESKDW